jgi:hypothetical protein
MQVKNETTQGKLVLHAQKGSFTITTILDYLNQQTFSLSLSLSLSLHFLLHPPKQIMSNFGTRPGGGTGDTDMTSNNGLSHNYQVTMVIPNQRQQQQQYFQQTSSSAAPVPVLPLVVPDGASPAQTTTSPLFRSAQPLLHPYTDANTLVGNNSTAIFSMNRQQGQSHLFWPQQQQTLNIADPVAVDAPTGTVSLQGGGNTLGAAFTGYRTNTTPSPRVPFPATTMMVPPYYEANNPPQPVDTLREASSTMAAPHANVIQSSSSTQMKSTVRATPSTTKLPPKSKSTPKKSKTTQKKQASFGAGGGVAVADGGKNKEATNTFTIHQTKGTNIATEYVGIVGSSSSVADESDTTDRSQFNRERNREHARSTRLRKKAYIQKLKDMAHGLQAVQTQEIRQRRVSMQKMMEVRRVRRTIIHTFLHYHSNHESDPAKWSNLVDDAFSLKQPITPFRSFRRSEVERVSTRIMFAFR